VTNHSKVAIVTGATKGIGRATALALCNAGWRVLGTGREAESAKALEEDLEARSGSECVVGDLTQEGFPEVLVARAIETNGRLDLLVNNAGIHTLASVSETTNETLDAILALNLRAAFILSRAAIPAMRQSGGGTIVNVGSEAGVVAVPGQAAYNISKAALSMLTKSIVSDHAKDGIRAVTVSPGTTRTELVENAIASAEDPEAHERWLSSSRPAKRLGRPDEIAAVIAFVASEQAPYLTGSEIVVDGGYTAV
jgi:NAD(P)-dependent dehydrogenase (short-subunit alcohol dehydrogenase family)